MVAPAPAPPLPDQSQSVVGSPFGGAGMAPMQGAGGDLIGNTWSEIHAFQVFDYGISPSQATQDAHRYDFVWGTSKPAAWKAGNPNIVTSWYAPFDGDFTTDHGLSWWKANHPDYVLYKCDRRTPAGMDGLQNVPLDISNPAVVKWQMQTYGPRIESGGYDALAEDLVGLNNANGGCGVWISGVWHQRFTGQIVDDKWSQAVLAWHRYAFSYLHGMQRPLLVAVNHVPENRPYGDQEEQQLINNVDIIDDESSFTDYGNGYASQQKVALIWQWMKYIQNLKKPYIVDDKWNTRGISHQQFDWAIGTYLAAKDDYSSVFIDHLPGYGYEYWYSQYGSSIGHPCGDLYADKLHAGVYYRKYTHAFVVVNTSTSSYNIKLPLNVYQSIWGGNVYSPMSLNGEDGAVLLTSLDGCL